jgi:hypothetical protein
LGYGIERERGEAGQTWDELSVILRECGRRSVMKNEEGEREGYLYLSPPTPASQHLAFASTTLYIQCCVPFFKCSQHEDQNISF